LLVLKRRGGTDVRAKIILNFLPVILYIISIGLNIALLILRKRERAKISNEEDYFE